MRLVQACWFLKAKGRERVGPGLLTVTLGLRKETPGAPILNVCLRASCVMLCGMGDLGISVETVFIFMQVESMEPKALLDMRHKGRKS